MTRHDAPTSHVSSESFQEGQTLPPAQRSGKLRAGGQDESPQLSWSGAPAGTRSYAVTLFDPDAPGRRVLALGRAGPPGRRHLPAGGAGAEDGPQLPPGALQLKNDAGFHGYLGAAPPPGHGPHRYVVTVHALDVEELKAGSRPEGLEAQLASACSAGHADGIYSR